jgi:beta-lactamase class A
MRLDRRAALAGAAGAIVAACQPRRRLFIGKPGRRLDTRRLDRGFPALADRARPATFALGVMDLEDTATWYWNTDRGFPLQSAFTLPLAAAALAEVEAGRLAPAERLAFSALELSPPPSAINEKWPRPPESYAAAIPIASLFPLALRWGDNTAADLLMKRIGGPGMVSAFVQQHGVAGLRVDRYERELQVEIAGMPTFRPDWKDPAAFIAARDAIPAPQRQAAMDAYLADPRDTATLPAALDFLSKLALGQLVSPASTARLSGWTEGSVGATRGFAAGLPAGARFAHHAGAAVTDLGFTPVMNDVGIATWPDERRFAIACFLVGSTATAARREGLFVAAARLLAEAAG